MDLGIKVSLITMISNIVLAVYKVYVGVIGKSTAMIADGIHTLSDVFTTLIVLIALKIAKKPADKEHPYGHGRAESIAAKILSLILMGVSLQLFKSGISGIFTNKSAPAITTLWAAIFSIIIKEIMYQATAYVGRMKNSSALMADALHHRSDAFSSIGTLIGILGARIGLYFMDGVGGLVVALLIFKMGFEIWKSTVEEFMDTQKDEGIREKIISVCQREKVMLNKDLLRLRHYGNLVFAEMTINVQASVSVEKGHEIAENIRNQLITEINPLGDVIIHIDPVIKIPMEDS